MFKWVTGAYAVFSTSLTWMVFQ